LGIGDVLLVVEVLLEVITGDSSSGSGSLKIVVVLVLDVVRDVFVDVVFEGLGVCVVLLVLDVENDVLVVDVAFDRLVTMIAELAL